MLINIIYGLITIQLNQVCKRDYFVAVKAKRIFGKIFLLHNKYNLFQNRYIPSDFSLLSQSFTIWWYKRRYSGSKCHRFKYWERM